MRRYSSHGPGNGEDGTARDPSPSHRRHGGWVSVLYRDAGDDGLLAWSRRSRVMAMSDSDDAAGRQSGSRCRRVEAPTTRLELRRCPQLRAGVDIGGTFTDIVLLGDDGERYTKKVSSTVDDYARAIVDGLAALLDEIGADAAASSSCCTARRSPRTRSSSTRAPRPASSPPRASATSSKSAICGCRGSTTCRGPSRRRWSSGGCGSRSTSGSMPQGGIDRPLDEASVERAVAVSGRRRGSRRSRSACCTPTSTRRMSSGSRRSPPRLAPGVDPVHQRRGAAGHQRIRAQLDDGHQRLCPADRRALPRTG